MPSPAPTASSSKGNEHWSRAFPKPPRATGKKSNMSGKTGMDDGTGALTVLLDRAADAEFRPPFTVGTWDVGERFDLVGVLVPLGAGTWALRPRTAFDLTPR